MKNLNADDIIKLKRNLEDTSHNEGSHDLACRLSDCKTYIEQLEQRVAALAPKPSEVPGLTGERESGQVYGIIDPDYGRIYTIIRKLAWEEGYAIGMHGSFTRDLDLIAVPWDRIGHGPEHLVRRIVQATGLKESHGNPGEKPHGRLVWTLLLPEFGDPRFVDLSIMPAQVAPAQAAPNEISTVVKENLTTIDAVPDAQAIRDAALEDAAKVCEGGSFLHDDAPDARLGRQCAKAIRAMKSPQPVVHPEAPLDVAQNLLMDAVRKHGATMSNAEILVAMESRSPQKSDADCAIKYRDVARAGQEKQG